MRPKNKHSSDDNSQGSPRLRCLADLLDGLVYSCLTATQPFQVMISSLTADSREVKASTLFIAVAGLKADGHRFIAQAISNGCAAVVVEKEAVNPAEIAAGVCAVVVADTRKALADIAANYYDHPARSMTFIGITGTNGKTTITYLLEHIFKQYGLPVGVIGTVSYRYSTPSEKKEIAASFTTPEPLLLQGLLRTMSDAGVRYILMEVSSHALFQNRLSDIQCDVAAFTNLSRDHLDYHAGMEEYFLAKTYLFTEHLKKEGKAVITLSETGAGENWQNRMLEFCVSRNIKTIQAGVGEAAEVRLTQVRSRRDGTAISLATAGGQIDMETPLVGRFNVDNIITTIAICQALGLDLRRAGRHLAGGYGAPGRLQRIIAGDESRPHVFVDYAHTPDALEKVLHTLAELPHRDLFCVFGCGGDRDTGKRPVMGAIAGTLCDVAVVTDDNPRSESSERIIAGILAGLDESASIKRDASWLQRREGRDRGFLVLPSREEAIATAISAAGSEDIVLIAGKGHEKYQIGPEGRRFFDDCLEAQEALTRWNCASIGKAIGGSFAGSPAGPAFRQVSTDSRTLAAGDIFVALQGDNFDGHDFLPQAVASGAACLIVSKVAAFAKYTDLPRFLVQDTQAALGALAAYRRRLLRSLSRPLLIGITGSCGKTTVKEMTAAILYRQWPDGPENPAGRVIKTKGNFNNQIGLPLSLLPLGVRHKAAILEMGTNHPGEIAQLAKIADPDISCIVSVHAGHLEGLKSIAGVAAAKEELFASTREEGILAINLDDEHIRAMAGKFRQKKITYSATEAGCTLHPDIWATNIQPSKTGAVSFLLHAGEKNIPVILNVPGVHNVGNSLAAAAIATAAGCSMETIAAGLEEFLPGDKRMVVLESRAGYTLINDTYNANPGSMAAALATLQQLAGGTSMAVLGDMLELGESSRDLHNSIGRIAVEKGVSYLAIFGEFAEATREGALVAGMGADRIRVFDVKEEIAAWIEELGRQGLLQKSDWILVKASRGMRFETIVQQLTVSP
jgi:MurE/MurF fusion protein